MENWSEYYKNVGVKPSSLVTLALEYIDDESRGIAVDIGAGNGRNSAELARRGFEKVLAVEPSPEVLVTYFPSRIVYRQETAGEFLRGPKGEPYKNAFDFVVCMNTFFFIDKMDTHKIVKRVVDALKPGGVFAFNVLGEYDEWAEVRQQDISFFTRQEIATLKSLYPPVHYNGIEKDGELAGGTPHHWHTHNFVYQKPA